MNECMWVLIAFVIVILLVLYINYLVTLHGRVRRLEHRASPRLEIIEREVHGIGCYMRIIIGIAIFFCVCVSVHYLCFCHPKIVSDGAPKPDALGTVVAIFGIVITLLVGWQIYSTIKAREELRLTKKDIEERLSARVAKLEDCCELRGAEISTLKSEIDERLNHKAKEIEETAGLLNKYYEAKLKFSQAMTYTLIADFQDSLRPDCFKKESKDGKETIEIRFQYSMAYQYFFEALVYYAQYNRVYSAMDACINNMSINLDRLESDKNSKEKFDSRTFEKCDKLYDIISEIIRQGLIDKNIAKRIINLNDRRSKIAKFDMTDMTGFKVVSGDAVKEATELLRKVLAEVHNSKQAEEAARKAAEPSAPDDKANPDDKPTDK